MKMHMWTFLTIIPSVFVIISAFPSPSFSLSFRLNTTLPCHGILKVVYMCMSNAMNMDVTSFFGAWPPACPLPGSPPRHKTPLLNEHSMHRRQSFTPSENTHAHTHTHIHTARNYTHNHMHKYIYIHACTHARTLDSLMLSFLLCCFSSLTFHNVFYIKIKEEGGGKGLKTEMEKDADFNSDV